MFDIIHCLVGCMEKPSGCSCYSWIVFRHIEFAAHGGAIAAEGGVKVAIC